MAEISKIKASDGVTYDIRDTSKEPIINASNKVPETFLSWGGEGWSGSVSPVGVALSLEHSSNRLAFIHGDALTFEYSSNGGSTWTNYNYSASDKSAFCTTSKSVSIGRPNGDTNLVANKSKTRITLTAQNGTTGYVYTSAKKMLVRVSSATALSMLVEYRTGTNYKNGGAWTTFGTYNVSGWSGWNDIPLVLNTLGGGTTQTGNNWQLRLTFTCTTVNSSYPKTAEVMAIRIFGDNDWTSPSTMASTGHLYSFDMSKNAVFPAGVSATSFTENGTALSSKYKASGAYSRATGNTTTVASNAHTHSVTAKGTLNSTGAHTHSVTAAGTLNSTGAHTHSVTAAGTLNSTGAHTHSVTAKGTLNSTGAHTHALSSNVVTGSLSGTVLTLTSSAVTASSAGGHSHTFTGSSVNTNEKGGHSHTFTGSAVTAASAGSHSHTFTGSAVNSSSAGGHSHTFTGSAATSGTPSANTTVPTSGHTHGVS